MDKTTPLSPVLRDLQEKLEKAWKSSPLAAPAVTLLGASKGQSAGLIGQAIALGLTDFGENRVQEAAEKWEDIRKITPKVTLHLIGALQTNKVKEALSLFDVIQTVDRPKLADEIARHKGEDLRCKRFFIQVNTGKEPQKAGVLPEEADGFIAYCKGLGLPVVGLMCVPPADHPPAPHFALLRQIAGRHGLTELSMGMSEDYETAARMGSTCVRIGRALFGERQ